MCTRAYECGAAVAVCGKVLLSSIEHQISAAIFGYVSRDESDALFIT